MAHPSPRPLHPVLADKLRLALGPAPPVPRTRRDARLPAVPGKVHSVIGMRRAGKTTFLHRLRDERRASLPPERAIFIGFDDDRLAGIEADLPGILSLNSGDHRAIFSFVQGEPSAITGGPEGAPP